MTSALRPMSTGEILDRTFTLYRGNFKLFAGIAAIPGAMYFIVQMLILLLTTQNRLTAGSRFSAAAIITTVTGSAVALIAYLVFFAVGQAATVFGVSAVHLEKPATVRECYARVKGHYGRMVNVIFSVYLRVFGILLLSYLVILAMVLIPSMGGGRPSETTFAIVGIVFFVGFIAGIVVAIRLFARYALAVPACALENIKARDAIKRSAFLAQGSLRKILAIYLLVFVVSMGVSAALTVPMTVLMVGAKTTALRITYTVLQHFATFIVGAVVGPLGTIALALVYYDERVRKEAYDILYLMEAASSGTVPTPQAPMTGAASPGV